MKNIYKLSVFLIILSSCAVKNQHNYSDNLRSRSYVEINLDNIKYLGEAEVSYEYTRYLLFGTLITAINEEAPNNDVKNYVDIPYSNAGIIKSIFEPNMKRALYKAYQEFPNADYLEISSSRVQTHKMFLGRKIKKSAKVKAFKYIYAE